MRSSPYYQLCPVTSTARFPGRHIRFVHRDPKLQEFHSLFSSIVKNSKEVVQSFVRKTTVVNVLKILNKIIPDKYFGIAKHRQLFYNIVKLILTSSANECIYMNQIPIGINFFKIPWLKNFLTKEATNTNSKAQKVLCRRYYGESQIWLLDKIVKPLVLRFYAPVRRGQMHEVEFVPRHIWMSFQTKVFNDMLKKKFLIPDTRKIVRSRGVLKIKPKDGYKNYNKFRPIMQLKSERSANLVQIRNIAKNVRCAAQKICKTKTGALYRLWKEYVSSTAGTPIFGAKIDIHDAFGNVNIEYLCYILENTNEISEESTKFLLGHIKNQYISFGKNKEGVPKIYQWKHGLLQGDRFSSVLCQLYLSHFDSIYLETYYKETTFLHRTVDDYFFCSTNSKDVEEFIKMMSTIHILNTNKTESNLPGYGHHEISYCGQNFLMETKEIQRFFNFPKRIEIRHRFKFWNVNKPILCAQGSQKTTETFLRKAMAFASNNFLFKNLELNTQFNNEDTVTKNFFQAMLMLAYKFDAAVMSLFKKIKSFEIVIVVIKQTVHKYAHRAIQILNINKGCYETGALSFQVFLKIGFQAFKLVLQRRSQYNEHNVGSVLAQCVKKISIQRVNFIKFQSLPKCFNNISIQRRLPHHKNYEF